MNIDTNLIRLFLNAQYAEYQSSENTISAYNNDLQNFANFLNTRSLSLDKAQKKDIEHFMIHLDQIGLSAATRSRKLSAIKGLYHFTFSEKLRIDDPALQIKSPKLKNRLPNTISERDFDALLLASKTVGQNNAEKTRNNCLMEVLYATGMRVTELVSLPVSTAQNNDQMLYIIGKGNKERLVPLSKNAKESLANWLKEWQKIENIKKNKIGNKSIYLFPSNSKNGFLSRIRFYNIVKEIALKANLNPLSISPHTLRHAFATHLLNNGADLRVIQTLLGHSDISSTEIYTHILTTRLKKLVQNYHPLSNSK